MAEIIDQQNSKSLIQDIVGNEEFLYRSVKPSKNLYKHEDGKLKISSQAFNDKRNQQPSVDRAKLRNNNPAAAKLSPNDGIICLLTEEVRNERVYVNNPQDPTEYAVDVKADPLDTNPSHAVIVPSPQYKSNSAFEKVKVKLAQLANKRGWTLEPKE